MQIGNDAQAVIRFNSQTRITVTIDGRSTQFNHQSSNGSFKTSLLAALNSVEGLSAAFSADGKLKLTAADSQSIRLADVQNGFLDFSGSPLGALGLTSGTASAQFLGYEQV